jgi:metal-responsive CopG/Arc/MetJ family transcriptional regulator
MKVAVSIPDAVFAEAERLAEQLRVPRSRLYADALTEYFRTRGAAQIRDQLDEVYVTESSGIDDSLVQVQVGSLDLESW